MANLDALGANLDPFGANLDALGVNVVAHGTMLITVGGQVGRSWRQHGRVTKNQDSPQNLKSNFDFREAFDLHFWP